jgi:hypothetical protein
MADEILSGLKGIKAEIKAVQDQMIGLDAGSQEFVKLAQRAGELRDQMKDVAEAVNANAGPAIGNFGNNLSIARGQLGELDITGFGESMKRMGANVKSVSFKDMTEGVKSVGGGFASLGKALLTNPIFLIATAILGIVANFEKLTQAGGLVGKIFGTIGDFVNTAKDAFFAFTDAIGLTDTKAAELAEAQKKRNEEMIADTKKANDEVDKMREGMARGRMTERAKELADIQKWFDEQLYAARGSEELRNEIIAVAREKRDEINAKYDKLDGEKATAAAEKKKALDEKEQKEKIDRRKVLSDFNAEQDAEDYQMALEQTEQMGKLGQEMTDKERERAIEKTEIAKTAYETLDGYDKVFVDQQLQRADEASQKQIEIERNVQRSKLEIAVQYLNAAQSLTDAMTTSGLISAEKAFKISKALGITQTTISTIMGVQNALNAVSTVPEPFGMALKVANAVAIGAAGAASIAKIAASQFNPGGGGGGGGLNTSTMPSPSGGGAMSAPTSQSPSALNLSFLQGNVNAAPLQTYVLAGQVSNAQQAEFKIKNTASILGGG